MLLKIFISAITLLNGCSSDSIKLQMMNNEIHVKGGETIINFDMKVSNGSPDNLLLYNFNSDADLAFREESFFCNENIAAGATIFVYDQKMKGIYAVIQPVPDEINYKPIMIEQVQQVIAEEKVKFRNSIQVIKTEEPVVFTKKVDLKNFRLAPGAYFIKLLYSSGDGTINMVTEDQMAEDRKKLNAEIFKGCVSSNFIRLIVD